jgi:hypothetical protein
MHGIRVLRTNERTSGHRSCKQLAVGGRKLGVVLFAVTSCYTWPRGVGGGDLLANMDAKTFDERGCCRWIRLKYYHYSLWTGLYMLDGWEKLLFSASSPLPSSDAVASSMALAWTCHLPCVSAFYNPSPTPHVFVPSSWRACGVLCRLSVLHALFACALPISVLRCDTRLPLLFNTLASTWLVARTTSPILSLCLSFPPLRPPPFPDSCVVGVTAASLWYSHETLLEMAKFVTDRIVPATS